MDPLRKETLYTYADYLTWDDSERYELIDGIAYMMAPAPNRAHQSISGGIFNQLYNFLKGKQCKVYAAPFDVRLNADSYDDTVVQPDITVVCDPAKLDDRGCKGAPDMVVEILSPSNSGRDTTLKLSKYLQAGVREFWVVDPQEKVLVVHLLDGDKYATLPYAKLGRVTVGVLDGCEIDLDEVFGADNI